jgi:hypothetical protein
MLYGRMTFPPPCSTSRQDNKQAGLEPHPIALIADDDATSGERRWTKSPFAR